MNENNLWLYSYPEIQKKTASKLVGFGLMQIEDVKVINELDFLGKLNQKLSSSDDYKKSIDKEILPFIKSWLVDSIKIIIFFENYMKAILLINGYLVHQIKKENEYENLSKEQTKRPIKLDELNTIKPYEIDTENKTIFHEALNFKTIGFQTLTKKKSYHELYGIEKELLAFIKKINIERNQLHLLRNVQFTLSTPFIENIERLKSFIQEIESKRK